MMNNEWGMTKYPWVGGHEAIGKVVALGTEVSHLSLGQRVGVGAHTSYCLSCEQCVKGDQNLCSNSYGILKNARGGFANR